MTATILLLNFSTDHEHALTTWGVENLGAAAFRSLPDKASLMSYLNMVAPFEHRDHPAPHIVVYFLSKEPETDAAFFLEVKSSDRGKKIPLILVREKGDEASLKKLYDLPISAVVELPSTDQLDSLLRSLSYWMNVVQLPLI